MDCERCGEFVATEHIAIVGQPVREVHLCATCAAADAQLLAERQRAMVGAPDLPGPNVHDFIRKWQEFERRVGREPSIAELMDIVRRLRPDHR